MNNQVFGICQSDILIRAAIVYGLEELRNNPWLLDYVFRGLRYDNLTSHEYGDKEIQAAKKWFLNSRVDVRMADLPETPAFPMVNIMLHQSTEEPNTLGDVHYDPKAFEMPETVGLSRNITVETFTPSYNEETGVLSLPSHINAYRISPDAHVIYDPKEGAKYKILQVIDDNKIAITPGPYNLENVSIVPEEDTYIVSFESSVFRESYIIGVHAVSEQKYAIYLHSIILFILLRWKQDLLEARGLERTTIASGPLDENQYFMNTQERVFSRTIQVSGYVRQYWPKTVSSRIENVIVETNYEIDENQEMFGWDFNL